MIQQAATVNFIINNLISLEVDCILKWGLKIDGQVDSLLDYTLEETIHNVQLWCEVDVVLEKDDADDMATYLSTTGKEITVDSASYDAVNDPSNYSVLFELWQGSNARTRVKLKFLVTAQ